LTFHSILDSTKPPPPHLSAPAGPDSPSLDSIRDYVLLQSAALLKIAGRVETYKEGVDMARESMSSGGAVKAWEGFKTASVEATKGAAGIVEEDGGEAAKGGSIPAWLHPKLTRTQTDEKKK
jgi:anthranilate phosphoribosyltransferase